MSELIPFTPEEDTTPERFFWDNTIRMLSTLAELSSREEFYELDPIDVFEELEGLKDEDQEDALTLLFNYATMITVPPGESSELTVVRGFLIVNGFIESEA